MATWYMADLICREIRAVGVVRETKHCVLRGDRCVAKVSDDTCYFPSWTEAKEWLVMRQGAKVVCLTDQLTRETAKLKSVEALEGPN